MIIPLDKPAGHTIASWMHRWRLDGGDYVLEGNMFGPVDCFGLFRERCGWRTISRATGYFGLLQNLIREITMIKLFCYVIRDNAAPHS